MRWYVALMVNDIVSVLSYDTREEMLKVVVSYAKIGSDVIATWTEIVT